MHHFQRKTDNMQTPERRPLHACYGQMEVKEHILLYILCTLRLQLVRGVRDFILAKIVRDLRWLLARRKADWLSPNSLISADVSICHSKPAGFGGFHDNNDNIPNPKGRHLWQIDRSTVDKATANQVQSCKKRHRTVGIKRWFNQIDLHCVFGGLCSGFLSVVACMSMEAKILLTCAKSSCWNHKRRVRLSPKIEQNPRKNSQKHRHSTKHWCTS